MTSASPLVIFVSLVWIVSCGVAAWKWSNPLYRFPPFLVATAGPFLLGWDNVIGGIITMNLVTAGFIVALRIEELWGKKQP